jgi:predicted patatin/cPLA2 family phospholipase
MEKSAIPKKKVVYIGGGAMAGVYSAGVMTSMLEDKDIFNKIEAVYASSAGCFVAAYFLAGQPEGASIFYDDLIANFITPVYVASGTYDRFLNRFIKTVPVEKMRNPLI